MRPLALGYRGDVVTGPGARRRGVTKTPTGTPSGSPVLTMSGVTVDFGPVVALKDVSLEV